MSMWCLGKCTYTEAYVRVAGQLGGGLLAFPLYHAISDAMKYVFPPSACCSESSQTYILANFSFSLISLCRWTAFGGPEFNQPDEAEHAVEAFLSESCATFLLMFVIYILNWEMNFGKNHYIIKQSLTAVAIRALIEYFPTAGPAMNPMLATAWAVFGVGTSFEFPGDFQHYFVYWVGEFGRSIPVTSIRDGLKLFLSCLHRISHANCFFFSTLSPPRPVYGSCIGEHRLRDLRRWYHLWLYAPNWPHKEAKGSCCDCFQEEEKELKQWPCLLTTMYKIG